MEKWKRYGQEINRLLRPQTFPLAVRVAGEDAQIPARAKRPVKDLGKKLAPCQGAALARKYGWTVAIQAEDSGCAIASFSYGWESPAAPLRPSLPTSLVFRLAPTSGFGQPAETASLVL